MKWFPKDLNRLVMNNGPTQALRSRDTLRCVDDVVNLQSIRTRPSCEACLEYHLLYNTELEESENTEEIRTLLSSLIQT